MNPPTREEIAEIICGEISSLDGGYHVVTDKYDRRICYIACRCSEIADALLARLRPAPVSAEALASVRIRTCSGDCRHDLICDKRAADERDAALARKDEALRACAEALADVRSAWPGKDGRDFFGSCACCGRSESEGCNRICMYGKVRAALVRPDVKEMKK